MSFDLDPRLEPVAQQPTKGWRAAIGFLVVTLVVVFLIMSHGRTPETAGMQPTGAASSSMATAPSTTPPTHSGRNHRQRAA